MPPIFMKPYLFNIYLYHYSHDNQIPLEIKHHQMRVFDLGYDSLDS